MLLSLLLIWIIAVDIAVIVSTDTVDSIAVGDAVIVSVDIVDTVAVGIAVLVAVDEREEKKEI